MTDYTTLAAIKAQIPESGLNTTTDYDSQLEALITTASRMIDNYLGKPANYFAPSSDGEVRFYDGNNDYELRIDDFITITALGVSLDGGVQSSDYITYDSTDYILEPFNSLNNAKPYNTIVLDVVNSTKDPFPRYRKAVKVTGIFGYSYTGAAPALIEQACKTQVIQWHIRSKSAWQNTGANETMLTDTGGELSKDVKTMLYPFMLEFTP